MKQVWIPRVGEPEVLEVREAPDPEPKAGQVRVRVQASGINFADILARMGLYPDSPKLPAVVGYEVAGTVEGVGEGVEGISDGDRVLCMTRFGGYSDVVCAAQAAVRAIPDNLDFEGAASIPVNYLTAWLMLVRLGNVRSGEKVLVHACAGGVGLAAVQICRHFGAEVIGTASAGKHQRLLEMGVSACIDYRTQDFQEEVKRLTDGRGVDIALDAVGGESFRKSYKSLADLGRLFVFGASSLAPGTKRSWISALTRVVEDGFIQTPAADEPQQGRLRRQRRPPLAPRRRADGNARRDPRSLCRRTPSNRWSTAASRSARPLPPTATSRSAKTSARWFWSRSAIF